MLKKYFCQSGNENMFEVEMSIYELASFDWIYHRSQKNGDTCHLSFDLSTISRKAI